MHVALSGAMIIGARDSTGPFHLTEPRTIAILGGGFCGATLAARLALRDAGQLLRIVLVERSKRQLATGPAYATANPNHLLNVPAGRMSAWPEEPDHFANWVRAIDPALRPDSFAPRRLYGQYLWEILRQAKSLDRSRSTLTIVEDEAIDIRSTPRSGAAVVHLRDSPPLIASDVVLALGNFPPSHPPPFDSLSSDQAYISDPWKNQALNRIGPNEEVLLLGTGLTMVDIAIALQSQGHQGKVTAVSRRGLLPQSHRSPVKPPEYRLSPAEVSRWPRSAVGLLRRVRFEIIQAAATGEDWRAVLNALRPGTSNLWRSLDSDEQARFLRHLRPWWDTHRHRMPASQAQIIRQMRANGRLQLLAGRLQSVRRVGSETEVQLRLRTDAAKTTIRVPWIINCTGPAHDLSRVDDELLRNLRRRGLIEFDPLRLGLTCAHDGAVIGAGGRLSKHIWALGSLRCGQLWESTAVPELRIQVKELAQRLTASSIGTITNAVVPDLRIVPVESISAREVAQP
ncbi:MAG: FAD/NAD(P)-binding protein [Phycisphaerales bacterium]|nr:FAD/NAD(P)-binding protein [Phycisphaerales bacterium]MCI0630667.1 FAD/NAD(P)-binding protein [Phycisphaerales bacterium]MCI0675587.1 FAD/NAD(P)-binding protein [Phycisphaerales bacterium]